jgi:hypothetical protein
MKVTLQERKSPLLLLMRYIKPIAERLKPKTFLVMKSFKV